MAISLDEGHQVTVESWARGTAIELVSVAVTRLVGRLGRIATGRRGAHTSSWATPANGPRCAAAARQGHAGSSRHPLSGRHNVGDGGMDPGIEGAPRQVSRWRANPLNARDFGR